MHFTLKYLPVFSLIFTVLFSLIQLLLSMQDKKISVSNKTAEYVIEEFFKKHYKDIELNLFKEINHANKTFFYCSLDSLQEEIKDTSIGFYLSDNMLFQLKRCLYKGIPATKFQLFRFNLRYQFFSEAYFKFMNKCRKKTGFTKRSNDYRDQHDLFIKRWSFYTWRILKFLYILVFIFSIIIVILSGCIILLQKQNFLNK